MTDTSRDPRFERLRKQAKRWLQSIRKGEVSALQRLKAQLPGHSEPPALREVQQALARELGFESWAALKEHHQLEAAASAGPDGLIDVFLEHACIFTPPRDLPVKWRRAERIRALHPEIATSNIHTAVVCGEVERVRELLDADVYLLTRKGGPQRWEPLLFACYGRLPHARAEARSVEVATLLLERGADPNTHFVTDDEWGLRFSALAGVMGQGEMGQPEHPHADALARLLLDRGADPNDGQALYNTHLVGDETRWLELLFEYGLGPRDPIHWHADPANAAKSGADKSPAILDYLVSGAASNGHLRRLELLLERGANPDAVSIYDGKSCYEHALMQGSREAVEVLARHGASVKELEGHDAFVAAVRSLDRARAEAAVGEHPEYRGIVQPLLVAASRGEAEVVRLLLELGVDPNVEGPHGHHALHNGCRYLEIARLLIDHGADPRARSFGGTACAWAWNAGDPAMARFHAEQSRSLLDAAACGHATLVRELLAEGPVCLEERSPEGDGPLHELCPDVEQAEPIIAALLAAGADPVLRNQAGRTPAQSLDEMGFDEVADLLEVMSRG